MRFLQIVTFYPKYLQDFYARFPDTLHASYDEQIDRLVADGFGGGHLIAPYMPTVGYESRLIIGNCLPAQARWARENGIQAPASVAEMQTLVARQVEQFRPDILYVLDPVGYDGRFLRTLRHKPHLTVGWRAATTPSGVDWSDFDLMLSSDEGCRQQALAFGAHAVAPFRPGFPSALARAVADVPKRWDIVFCGQVSGEHGRRLRHLTTVGRACRAGGDQVLPGFFLGLAGVSGVPPDVAAYDRGSVWGMPMYQAVRSGRIGLNFHIDMATTRAQNMRVLETTGCGTFLLTEDSPELAEQFIPGREVETYRDDAEMLEKIQHYLSHPEECALIARRGQERCLADHSMDRRAAELDGLVRNRLALANHRTIRHPDADRLAADALACFREGRLPEARALAGKALLIQPNRSDMLHLSGVLARREGRVTDASTLIVRALAAAPNAPDRWSFLANLGAVLNDAGKIEEAIAAYARAEELSASAVLPYTRGQLLQRTGRLTEAGEAYWRALSIDPTHSGARAALEALSPEARVEPSEEMVLARAFPGVTFGKGVQCLGIANTRIGSGSCVADDSWLNVCLRGTEVRLSIGRNVLIGRRAVIAPGTFLEIGDFTILAPNVYLASGEHQYKGNHLRPLYSTGIVDHGSLIIEENCWFGINSVACGGIEIGRGSVIGANSVLRDNVPPFSVVVGAPARIVRMFNPMSEAWEHVRTPEDVKRIEADRHRKPLPSRKDYAAMLHASKAGGLDPIVAGREQHLF